MYAFWQLPNCLIFGTIIFITSDDSIYFPFGKCQAQITEVWSFIRSTTNNKINQMCCRHIIDNWGSKYFCFVCYGFIYDAILKLPCCWLVRTVFSITFAGRLIRLQNINTRISNMTSTTIPPRKKNTPGSWCEGIGGFSAISGSQDFIIFC